MIDVIIPAYNCEKTLARTLASLQAQTDTNFHVIIVDDCSDQDIKSIVDRFVNILNITYIRNEYNIGCGMSRQVGIDNSTAKFFTFLDSDDMFMPYTVETFNSIILENPNIQFIHSYFYQQIMIENDPALMIMKDGYTWCHGKLYNIEYINKFNIRNSPLVKYADDSYFNSMCSELLEMHIVRLPLVLWTNNMDSITRRKDSVRDKTAIMDLLNALYLSTSHILQYKDNIVHLERTLNEISKRKEEFNEDEIELYKKLYQYIRKEK